MPKTLFQSKAHLQDGMQVKVSSRGFEVTIDEPPELGGKDTGMNPVELILCSLGACQAIVARSYAGMFNIDLEDFWVDIEGDLDTDGFMNISDVRRGYSDIRYTIHIQTDAPRDKVEEFVAFIEKTCPIGDTIANQVNVNCKGIIIEQREPAEV